MGIGGIKMVVVSNWVEVSNCSGDGGWLYWPIDYVDDYDVCSSYPILKKYVFYLHKKYDKAVKPKLVVKIIIIFKYIHQKIIKKWHTLPYVADE